MKTTIVKFYAFNKPMQEVFTREETPEQIHEVLFGICDSYQLIEILEGELQNVPMDDLIKLKSAGLGMKLNKEESAVLIEALEDFKRKASETKELIKVGFDKPVELEQMFNNRIHAASTLQKKLQPK